MTGPRVALPVLLLCALSLAAQEPRPALLKNPLTLQEALEQLRQQTGNTVADLRTQKTNPTLRLARPQGTFWPLLDHLAETGGLRYTPYGEGGVALVDGPPRAVPTTYSGLFRLAVKRLASSLDFETKAHFLHVTLDVAWEPRFLPFYLDVRALSIQYVVNGVKVVKDAEAAHGQVAIAGRTATELELRLDATPRNVPRLAVLAGKLAVIGPSRMLDFTFAKLAPVEVGQKPRQEMQDGVTVSLTRLVAGRDRWTVDVLIENPPGGPVFESFQSWLENNKAVLVRPEGGKPVAWPATEEQQLGQLTARRAHVRYYFPIQEGERPGSLADWTLQYRTPGRIVRLDVPFEFKDLPLP